MADRVLTVEQAMERIARKLRVGLLAAANRVRTDAVAATKRPQPTRVTRKGRRVGLDPSREGEPPKQVTSNLNSKILLGDVEKHGNVLVAPILAGTEYARRLEFGFVGTDAKGRRYSQGPRPFLRPALERVRPRLAEIIQRAAEKA